MGDEGITRRRMIRTTVGGVAGLSAATSVWGTSTTTAPAPLRLGVIGIGNRCRAHLQIIRGLAGRCQVTTLCDVVRERAEAGVKLAGGGDIRTFARHADLLRAGLCDAVVVTTPNYTHAPIALDALQAGLHVLCEKPMATNLADAKRIVEAVNRAHRVFAVGLQFRYAAIYRKVRELVQAGAIGDLKYIWAEEFRGDWARLYQDPAENAKKN